MVIFLMKSEHTTTLALIIALSLAVVGCSGEPGQNTVETPDGSVAKKNFPAQELVGRSVRTVPDTGLVNQNRESFDFSSLPNRPTLLSFIYTRCPMSDMCPLITRKMQQVQSNFASGNPAISLVTVTFDAAYDTPAVLKSHAKSRGVDFTNWEFVTGPESVVEEVISTFKISTKTVADGQVVHNLRTYLIGPDGRVKKWYRGSDWSADTVTEEIRGMPTSDNG